MKFVFDRAENIVRKGESASYWQFSPVSHNVFKSFNLRVVRSWDCVVKVQYAHKVENLSSLYKTIPCCHNPEEEDL